MSGMSAKQLTLLTELTRLMLMLMMPGNSLDIFPQREKVLNALLAVRAETPQPVERIENGNDGLR